MYGGCARLKNRRPGILAISKIRERELWKKRGQFASWTRESPDVLNVMPKPCLLRFQSNGR